MILLYELNGRTILDIPGWMTGTRIPDGSTLLKQWPHYVRFRSLESFLAYMRVLPRVDCIRAFSAGGHIALELLQRNIVRTRYIDMHAAPCMMPVSLKKERAVTQFAEQAERYPQRATTFFYRQCGEGVIPISYPKNAYPRYWYRYVYDSRPVKRFQHINGHITHGSEDRVIPSDQLYKWSYVFPAATVEILIGGQHAQP